MVKRFVQHDFSKFFITKDNWVKIDKIIPWFPSLPFQIFDYSFTSISISCYYFCLDFINDLNLNNFKYFDSCLYILIRMFKIAIIYISIFQRVAYSQLLLLFFPTLVSMNACNAANLFCWKRLKSNFHAKVIFIFYVYLFVTSKCFTEVIKYVFFKVFLK